MAHNSKNIEQFIRTNRAAFDAATPGPYCWPAVEKTLDRLRNADGLEQYTLLNRPAFDTAEPSETVWGKITQTLDGLQTDRDDPLESFIRTNRDAFDAEAPDLRVWASIEQAVPAQTAKVVHVRWQHYLLRSAAAIALLVSGITIGIWYSGNNNGQPSMAMSDLSSEYAELEQYYQRDISTKKNKLTRYASYSDKIVLDDLRQMDNAMHELREELANVPPGNREQVVRAMIENYQAKAAILERVLQHLEHQQQTENQQPATTNSGNYEVEKI